MDVVLSKIASITRNIPLPQRVQLTEHVAAVAGRVLAVEVLEAHPASAQMELTTGRLATLMKGDVLAVCLGSRRALRGFVGDVPERVAVGDVIHLLSVGGVVGTCRGGSTHDVGQPIPVRVLGGVLLQGVPVAISDFCTVASAETLQVCASLVLVSGTSMNIGKTASVCELIKQFTAHGHMVAAGKLTGISRLRDCAAMADHGATTVYDFTDAGLPSTTDRSVAVPLAKGILNALDRTRPDVLIVELGDGLMGGYGVREILTDPQIQAATQVHVLCAGDPVGAKGGADFCTSLGLPVHVVTGPATDNCMGTDFVRDDLGLRSANARSDGHLLYEHVAALSTLARASRPGCP